MNILNIGSINIDYVYQMDHIVRPGETLASRDLVVAGGGKGANQSLALGRAGVPVRHAGAVGTDGAWLVDTLAASGVDTRWIRRADVPTGQAIIQVSLRTGENAIILAGGANRDLKMADILPALDELQPGDIVLLQNEINLNRELITAAASRKLAVCLNPAPFENTICNWALDRVAMLILNEHEAAGLLGLAKWDPAAIHDLQARHPQAELLVTMGSRGVIYRHGEESHWVPADKVKVVDTTAAGDTFIGYFLACRVRGLPVTEGLRLATRAAGLCVTRPGAMDSIPAWDDVAKPA